MSNWTRWSSSKLTRTIWLMPTNIAHLFTNRTWPKKWLFQRMFHLTSRWSWIKNWNSMKSTSLQPTGCCLQQETKLFSKLRSVKISLQMEESRNNCRFKSISTTLCFIHLGGRGKWWMLKTVLTFQRSTSCNPARSRAPIVSFIIRSVQLTTPLIKVWAVIYQRQQT